MGRRRNTAVRRLVAAMACLAAVAASCLAFGLSPARAQDRSISVTPHDQLVDGQYVFVTVSGFPPDSDIRLRLCAPDATSVGDCALDPDLQRDPGHSKLLHTGAQGQGNAPVVVKALDVQRMDGTKKFQCDTEHSCKLYAFELDANGNDVFANSASTPLSYALSSIPCPETEPRVAGSGATAIRADMVEWQAETCHPPLSLDVSFATSNSVNGKQAFVNGLTDADFAISGIPLTDVEKQALASRKVTAVHVPVAVASLVLVYNLWFDKNGDGTPDQITDLQLSPATAAGILQGRIGNWNDPAIAADNKTNYPDGLPSKRVLPVGRADNSGATWWLSSWLYATAKDAWEAGGDSFKDGPTAIFPAGNGVNLRTGAAAVANQIRTFPGEQGVGDVPEAGLIGFVYMSDAIKLGLPVAALKNEGGAYVKPTTDSLTAAISDGTVSADGVFTPNFHANDPKAYPVPVVTYAIVPTAASGTPPFDPPHEQVLSKFLTYAVGDGQKSAELRGYLPLPTALSAKSNEGIAQVYRPVSPSPTPSPSPAPTSGQHTGSTTTPGITRPANDGVQGAGTTVQGLPGGTSGSQPTPAPEASTTTTGPAAAAIRTVNGVLKLVGGGHAPVTVGEMIVLGVIALIIGRLLSVVGAGKRPKQPAPPRSLASVGERE